MGGLRKVASRSSRRDCWLRESPWSVVSRRTRTRPRSPPLAQLANHRRGAVRPGCAVASHPLLAACDETGLDRCLLFASGERAPRLLRGQGRLYDSRHPGALRSAFREHVRAGSEEHQHVAAVHRQLLQRSDQLELHRLDVGVQHHGQPGARRGRTRQSAEERSADKLRSRRRLRTIPPTQTVPGTLNDNNIQDELHRQISAGNLPVPNGNTVFAIYFPNGVLIQLGNQIPGSQVASAPTTTRSPDEAINPVRGVLQRPPRLHHRRDEHRLRSRHRVPERHGGLRHTRWRRRSPTPKSGL